MKGGLEGRLTRHFLSKQSDKVYNLEVLKVTRVTLCGLAGAQKHQVAASWRALGRLPAEA